MQTAAGGAQVVTAVNPAQRLAIEAHSDGVVRAQHRKAHESWTVSLIWTGLGRGAALEPVTLEEAAPSVEGSRLTYPYARGQKAWYANGPRGLEQGFVLDAPPAGQAGGEALAIEVSVRGDLAPVPAARTQKVALRSAQGQAKAWYKELFAYDAQGRTLASWMEATESAIRLRVVDAQAAYPILIDPLLVTHEAKLLASDGLPDDEFGQSVALDGDTALVGARSAAYVFARTGEVWTQQAKLLPSDGLPDDRFGQSVALDGDTAIVGAPYHDALGGDSGAAYVFVRSGGVWTEQAKLLAADGVVNDWFGTSVSVLGDNAVVGAPGHDALGSASGAAYVFVRTGAVWTQEAKLLASNAMAGAKFGTSTALDGDRMIVAAPYHGFNGFPYTPYGAAYIFVRVGGGWMEETALGHGGMFGAAVALSGDTAVAGVPVSIAIKGYSPGKATVYVRTAGMWVVEESELWPTYMPNFNPAGFGRSVAVEGDTVLVGSTHAPDDLAFLFTRQNGVWTQQGTFPPGYRIVALSGDTVLLGNPTDDEAGTDAGAAYVARWQAPPACATDSECSSGFCADGVCCDSACGDGAPDDCQACNLWGFTGTCVPLAAGSICLPAADVCDVAEQCDGTSVDCPADGVMPAGTTCRAQAWACDVVEQCTGLSRVCPVDGSVPDGTPCPNGVCMAGVCEFGSGGAGGSGGSGGGGAMTGSGGSPADLNAAGGTCTYGASRAPRAPNAWLWVLGLLFLARRRARPTRSAQS